MIGCLRPRLGVSVAVGLIVCSAAALAAGCGGTAAGGAGVTSSGSKLDVVATTSVLTDIAQNVAGDRFTVRTLMPPGADPHSFQPTPADLKLLVDADLVIVNGAALEGALEKYLSDVAEGRVVVASRGLEPRTPGGGETGHSDEEPAEAHGEPDPHFWLDPTLVKTYVRNIERAFEKADPAHAGEYEAGAEAYERKLADLDAWIEGQVAAVPPERRKLVMNHASYGYWADRYGFRVVGAVIPGISTGAAPTAREMADLLATIEREGVPAVFVEAQEDPRLAAQIAADTGITVVDDLYDHSLSGPAGPARTYIDMMRWNCRRIVEALSQP